MCSRTGQAHAPGPGKGTSHSQSARAADPGPTGLGQSLTWWPGHGEPVTVGLRANRPAGSIISLVRCSTRELREVPGRACAVGIQQIQACGRAGYAAGPGVRLGRACGWAGRAAGPGVRLGRACGWAGRAAGPGVRLGRPGACGWASESGRLWANTLTAVPLRPCVPTAASTHWATAQCPLIMIGRRLSRGCSSGCGLQSRCRCTARLQHSGSESQAGHGSLCPLPDSVSRHCPALRLPVRQGSRLWPTGRPAVPAPRASKAGSESLKYCAKIWDDEWQLSHLSGS